MEIVKKKTSRKLPLRESMKLSVAYLLMRMKKLRSTISHQRNNLYSSDILMRVLLERIQKKPLKRKE